MILEILGYSALLASVAGATIVWHHRYGIYAYILWMFSNPVMIGILLFANFEFAKELIFVAYCVMGYTAFYGFIFKKWLYKRCNRKEVI